MINKLIPHSKLLRILIVCLLPMFFMFLHTNSNKIFTKSPEALLKEIDQFLALPSCKAFLDVIAYAEGTYGDSGYNMLFGGHTFKRYDDHPRVVIGSKSYSLLNRLLNKDTGLRSSAAGRYQILERTWDSLTTDVQLLDFSPLNQDRAALTLLIQVDALDDIINNKFDNAIKKSARIWASLPGSKYGQKVLPLKEVKKFFDQQLSFHKQQAK